jgi:uncharacterized protein (TIGR02598 family)
MSNRSHAFSLVEVVIAVGLMSFALVAIFGLMPVGMKSVGEAVDATRTSMIAADVEGRIKNMRPPIDFSSSAAVAVGPFYYDRQGVSVTGASGGFYRVDATVASTWATQFTNVDQTQSYLRPATGVIRWPIDNSTGNPMTNGSSSTFTLYVAKP